MKSALAFIAAVAAATPALAATPFDGAWNVVVHTQVGPCPSEISGTVFIENGDVKGTSAPGIGVWGGIDLKGQVSTRFTQDRDMLRAFGKATHSQASGAWSSNTKYCGGRWEAHRAR